MGDPGGRRVSGFQAALRALGRPEARVISWVEAASGALAGALSEGSVLRLDSPEGDEEARRLFLRLGEGPVSSARGERLLGEPVEDGSGLRYALQQHLGFLEALSRVERQLGGALCLTPPAAVAAMCDKRESHRRFSCAGLPVPRSFEVADLESLRAGAEGRGLKRLFIKLWHGSSAAGTAAWVARPREHLVTSLCFDGETPYSSLRLRRTADQAEIDRALGWLFSEGAQVEEWLPKARIDGREFDLRIVVIQGLARHVVARVARRRNPMTNLHLGNERGSLEAAERAVGGARWRGALELAEAAAACFPGARCAGVDVAFSPGGPVLIEINAFGDLLPGALWRGMDPHQAQLALIPELQLPPLRG